MAANGQDFMAANREGEGGGKIFEVSTQVSIRGLGGGWLVRSIWGENNVLGTCWLLGLYVEPLLVPRDMHGSTPVSSDVTGWHNLCQIASILST